MKLTFKVDVSELYNEDTGNDFQSLFSESLTKAVIENANKKINAAEFKKFADLTSDTIVADIKLRMENFLTEEIVLTGRYGEKDFVGSIEDLIKKRFDDVLLRPVDNSGKTLQGCTSSSKTWIEWCIEGKLEKFVKDQIEAASRTIQSTIKQSVERKIVELKDSAIKKQVDSAFTDILKASK